MPTRRRVLVVEDDPATRVTMEETLLAGGFQVDGASDSAAALRKIRNHRYDLAIVDLMLPDMDGVLLRGKIQRADPNLSSRMIFITGFTNQPTVVAYLKRAGRAFLAKPFRPEKLMEVVRTSLEDLAADPDGSRPAE